MRCANNDDDLMNGHSPPAYCGSCYREAKEAENAALKERDQLRADLAALQQRLEEYEQDEREHAGCATEVHVATVKLLAAEAEAARLRDWRDNVTVAYGSEHGGAHFDDVAKGVRGLRERVGALEALAEMCGMYCERLPYQVRSTLHLVPEIGKTHSCAALAAPEAGGEG